MNILIVTPFYKHDKNIASVRWTNLATRLAKRHHVIVVTQPNDDMDMQKTVQKDEDGILVARINQKTAYEKIAIKLFGGATGDDWQTTSSGVQSPIREGMVRKLKNHVLLFSMKIKARQYASQIIREVIPKNTKIDAVISSACPFIEMLFGYELKKKLKCRWLSDFRDLPYKDESRHDAQLMKKIMQKALTIADIVTNVAESGKKYLQEKIVKDVQKVHVLTNGFSMTEAREAGYQDDKKLHIVHTGSLYGGTRRADIFFKAAQMAHEKLPEFSYVLECAGGNNQSLIDTAQKYGEENNVEDRGFVTREEALSMQVKSDILLTLNSNNPGSFSAKLYEYTLNRKPIISISPGGPNTEETQYVRKLNLGIATEQVSEKQDVLLLCDYLLQQYGLKAKGMPLIFEPRLDLVWQYDHDTLVKKVEEFIGAV